MVRSAAHPIRAKALSIMAERPTSPKEIAAVGKPIGNVAYHIDELERAGMAVLVDEKKRGGATEHFYLATTIDDEASSRLDPHQRALVAQHGLHLIIADAAQAVESGTLSSRPDVQMARIPLYLDEEGWREIRDLYAAALDAPSRRRPGAPRDSRKATTAASARWRWRCSSSWPASPKEIRVQSASARMNSLTTT